MNAKKYIQHAMIVKTDGVVIKGKISPDYIAMNKALKAYHKAKKQK